MIIGYSSPAAPANVYFLEKMSLAPQAMKSRLDALKNTSSNCNVFESTWYPWCHAGLSCFARLQASAKPFLSPCPFGTRRHYINKCNLSFSF